MAKEKHQPKVPGEAGPAESADPTTTDPMVTVPQSAIDALQRQIDELANKLAVGVRPARKATEQDLPDASTIDAEKITAPVLTRTGWLVPHKYGSNAAQPKG